MRVLPTLILACLLVLASALSPREGSGQECPAGEISYIFIDNNSIFDLAELDPDIRFRWAYGLANKVHVRTREEFLLDELLFGVGDCLDTLLLEETERLLRSYRFIGYVDVFSVPQPDGTHHVNVYTRDEWTTKMDLGLRLDDGLKVEGVEVSEENLLGRGVLVRGFLKKDKEVQDMGVEMESPRFFGTRWDTRISLGNTRIGNFFEGALTYPFIGEIGRFGARQSFLWRETVFSYSASGVDGYSHLLLPFLDQRWDIAVGGRLGSPGDLTILGAGLSRESIEFRDFPDAAEWILDKDFANPVAVDSVGAEEVRHQTRSRRANRLNVFLGKRRVQFVQRRGLDALRGVQDVAVGTEVFLGFGRAWRNIQEGGGISSNDTHAQGSFFAGGVWDGWVFNAQASTEARLVSFKHGAGVKLRDTFAEADMLFYFQPHAEHSHTLLFRLSAAGGWSVETPFQLTLGGRTSLRGYRDEHFPGARRVIMTLEDRVPISSPAPGFADMGLAFFLDVGQIWAGDVPFGMNSRWLGTFGAGLRIGLPPGTKNVLRIDLALPMGKRTQLNDLVVRVNLRELLGLLPGMRDRQILRSLRSGVRPTFITSPW